MRTLLVDNYDSFTYNLFHLLGRVYGRVPTVVRNDDRPALAELDLRDYSAVVISPGPGSPDRDRDFGISRWAVVQTDLPVLGVCLGHQGLWYAYGARLARAPQPMHGLVGKVFHGGDPLFDGIPSPFAAVRYHSLAVYDLPDEVEAIAWSADGILMAARHRRRAQWGVQFHPESICTEYGERLIANFRDLTVSGAPTTYAISEGTPVHRAAATGSTPRRARGPSPLIRELSGGVADPEAAFAQLFGAENIAFWLDSALRTESAGRFSLMGAATGRLGEMVTYDVSTGEIVVRDGDGTLVEQRTQGIFDYLAEQLETRRLPATELPFDFALGYVGSLGYELKAECGGTAAHRSATPDASLIFPDRVLVIDHADRRAWLVAAGDEPRSADAWFDEAEGMLAATVPLPELPDPPADRGGALTVSARHSPAAYAALIASCQELIAAGESYEICLTNMLTIPAYVDPWLAYRVLRRVNPAPLGAYLRFPGCSVLSSSPERFLRVDAAGIVESKPIKGTRPRGRTLEDDARLADELRHSTKERAENLMIVDLARNDIGRVAALDSVHVPMLFDVETYETVHQLVSTVRGRLAPGATVIDCVRAAFPAGSMTGAPKLRAMEILDRLEAGPRGIYSGAIGYFSLSGTADLSVAIRCMVITEHKVTIGTGGAITALSEPDAEIAETRVKARALIESLARAAAEAGR